MPKMACSDCGDIRAVTSAQAERGHVTCHRCRRKRRADTRSHHKTFQFTCTCGEPFTTTVENRKRCDDCAENENVFRPSRANHVDHRERARRYGVKYEPINPLIVFMRDGYRCGLCGSKCPARRKVPDPRAPTIDHIVPMSRGGDHLYVNVQCAHFSCNSKKSNQGGGEQLAFIG